MNYILLRMKPFSLFIFFFFLIISLKAQPTSPPSYGKIKGVIKDSLSGAPVEYATIAVYQEEDNKILTGTTSGANGTFSLDKIPQGTYRIVIDFIGY